MKKIGLIGGTSWVSTLDYYKLINEGVNEKLGGNNFAEFLIYSFNYADIIKNNETNNWDDTYERVMKAAEILKYGGAEAILFCANTIHLIAERFEQNFDLPLIHIGSVTANEVAKSNIKTVALLGTKFTMEKDFIKTKFYERGIQVLIPETEDRNFIHQSIFNELGKGILKTETKERYIQIMKTLIQQGAEGIILGCTEIPLLIKPDDLNIPLFDTTLLHAKAAVEFTVSA